MILPAFQALTSNPGSEYHSLSQFLTQAIQSKRVSHAYIIKAEWEHAYPLILALASALLCPDQGCHNCNICRLINEPKEPNLPFNETKHSDLHFILPESKKSKNLSVKQIRALVQQVTLPPTQSEHQIFALANADQMNVTSANTLLKTLEEPPSNTIMLLVTPHLNQILPTIRSRAQVLYLETDSQISDLEMDLSYPDWKALLTIRDQDQRFELLGDLEKLDKPHLLKVLSHYQSGCWQSTRTDIKKDKVPSQLKFSMRWLKIFEKSIQQLESNANKRLILEFLSQDIWKLNQTQSKSRV